MKSFLVKAKNYWPPLVLFVIVSILFVTNYVPGTFLTGWDNLHPEFNPGLNITRSIFAVWQEYQGLGVLGGMAHASDLPHQIILALLSIFLPVSSLRYVWIFLMLFLGSLGTYVFAKKLFSQKSNSFAFFASLFYLLNLATMQMFYAPFESFVGHFAALPWLLWACITYLSNQSKRNTVALCAVLLLATPSQYLPTLFVSFMIALGVVVFGLMLSARSAKIIKPFGKLLGIIFLINAFWLLPFLYFTATNAKVALNAKMNQMSTETIFLQNKEFGNVKDVMLLKGFWFNNVDPNRLGIFDYMLSPWKAHLSNLPIELIGFAFFAVILFGALKAFKNKRPIEVVSLLLFIFSFTMLAVDTFPFSWIDILFRKLPLFQEAFRFPFTKFSILTAFSYSLLFGLGIEEIGHIVKKAHKHMHKVVAVVAFVLVCLFALPSFKGHLFYDKERLKIPSEYSQVFDFFNHQNPNTRIADFPQYQFWGWNFYSWGYGGSGFLWYGISQPIADRAFDVWGKSNENYYFELSHALYTKDPKKLVSVLNKYQINWIMMDRNIINPNSEEALFYPEFDQIVSRAPQITKVKTFGRIDIYKVNLNDKINDFVFSSNLTSANGYNWGDYDQAYGDLGNYSVANSNTTQYLFRSLFSNKTDKEIEYNIKEEQDSYEISQKITTAGTLSIPPYFDREDILPIQLSVKTDKSVTFSLQVPGPRVEIGDEFPTTQNQSIDLVKIQNSIFYPLTFTLNGIARYTISKDDLNKRFPVSFLVRDQNNSVVITDNVGKVLNSTTITPTEVKSLEPIKENSIRISQADIGKKITVIIPKIEDLYLELPVTFKNIAVRNCDNFRKGTIEKKIDQNSLTLSSKNATACLNFYNSNLDHNESYILFLKTAHSEGRRLSVWLLNENEDTTPLSTYLSADNQTFIIPPMEKFGKAYSIHIENGSIGQDKTQNTIYQSGMFEFPYRFLSSIKVESQNTVKEVGGGNLSAYHPNSSLYIVQNASSPLILSQSFDKAWTAYSVKDDSFLNRTFPFLFGKRLNSHVLVNNWENGWVLDSSISNQKSVIIVYLPQYLEYLGFAILIGTAAYLFRMKTTGGNL